MAGQASIDPRAEPEAVSPAPFVLAYERHERFLIGAATMLGCLIVWQLAASSGFADPQFVSSPLAILRAARAVFSEGDFYNDLRLSGVEFLVGYVAAVAVGVPLGLAVGWYRRLNFLVAPFINVLNVVPRVTLLPLVVIWFGIGLGANTVVVFLSAVIPILISTISGVRTNEERFLRVARSVCASEFKIFTSIVVPGTVPFIFTGLKYAAGRALLGVIVSELYASSEGVGHFIAFAGSAFQTDRLFVGIIVVMVAGLAVVGLLGWLERHFDKWRPPVVTER